MYRERNGHKKKQRAWKAVQCSACGCGWAAGFSDESQEFCAKIAARGWGIPLVPDCSGCPCHTGEGVLPHIKEYRDE